MRFLRTKSYFSVITMAIGIFLIIVWALIGLIGAILGYTVEQFTDVLLGLFIFFFCVAGIPWGWSTFWPFWCNHLSGFHFTVFAYDGGWFVISLLFNAVFFVAKILILPALCIGLGWIFMLVHIPDITSSVF